MSESNDGIHILRIDLRHVGVKEFVRQDELLWRAPLLAALSESERDGLLDEATVRIAESGERILSEQEPAAAIHFVLDGSVVLSTGGGSIDLASLGKGDFFGLSSVFSDAVRCTASAPEGGARLALLPAGRLGQLAQSLPALGQLLAKTAQQRRDRARECSEFFDMW
jgi:CRP-like cAMP-binding protein